MVTVILSYLAFVKEVDFSFAVAAVVVVAAVELQRLLVEVQPDCLKIQRLPLIVVAIDLAIVQDSMRRHSNLVVDTFVAKAFPHTVCVPTFANVVSPSQSMQHPSIVASIVPSLDRETDQAATLGVVPKATHPSDLCEREREKE
jgi:hypothetical protein